MTSPVRCRVFVLHSDQPVLRREERLHVGGVGGGDAAADGAEPPPNVAHAHRHPVAHHVSPPGRLRHEHPVPPHRQAGRRQTLLNIPVFLTHFSNINVGRPVFPAGVEVSQSVGGLCKVLPADQASVVQRAAAAATRSADQRV